MDDSDVSMTDSDDEEDEQSKNPIEAEIKRVN